MAVKQVEMGFAIQLAFLPNLWPPGRRSRQSQPADHPGSSYSALLPWPRPTTGSYLGWLPSTPTKVLVRLCRALALDIPRLFRSVRNDNNLNVLQEESTCAEHENCCTYLGSAVSDGRMVRQAHTGP